MKLALLRHGKSSWKNIDLPDHDRPLKKRGVRDSLLMANEILKLNYVPEHIFCSTSERTSETCQILLKEWKEDEAIVSYVPELYLSGIDVLISHIKSINNISNVMIIGHNPGLHDLIEEITDSGLDNFQTGAYVLIKFPIHRWSEVLTVEGKIIKYLYPKMFKG